MKHQPTRPPIKDDDYSPSLALGVVVLTIIVLTFLIAGLWTVRGL